MTLETLKEEYKKALDSNKFDSQDDYDQLVEEIDDADNLDEFVGVVGRWSVKGEYIPAERIILERILSLN